MPTEPSDREPKHRRGLKEVLVSIIKTPTGCCVVPPIVNVRREVDEIIWHAVNVDAEICFPTSKPFGWHDKPVKCRSQVSSGPALEPGAFDYSVFCTPCSARKRRATDEEETGEFAKGNSPPTVIVW